MAAIRPPKGLQKAGRDLWKSIAAQWFQDDLTPDARERRLLEDACREADQLQITEDALAEAVAAGNLMVRGSQGQPVSNPLLDQCRRSRAEIRASLLKLGLEDPAAATPADLGTSLSVAEAGRRGAMRRHHGSDTGLGGV